MPIYSFTCPEHGNFDEIVPFDTEQSPCPKCQKESKREGIEVPARRNPAYGIG